MGEAVPPLPQYAFMGWYSVRESTGVTIEPEQKNDIKFEQKSSR
jgi:hypothetical protein